MLMRSFPALSLLVAALLARPALAETPGAADDFQWRDDLEGSRKVARDQGKPLLIVFR